MYNVGKPHHTRKTIGYISVPPIDSCRNNISKYRMPTVIGTHKEFVVFYD